MYLNLNNRTIANILHFKSIDSTNSYLMSEAKKGMPSWTVTIADHQTNGRGRLGRRFESEDQSGLYMSVLIRDIESFDPTLLTVIASVSVCEAIEAFSNKQMTIKWVNDILFEGKKVCGILTEGAFNDNKISYAVVGVGINISKPQNGYPEDIKNIADAVFDNYSTELRDQIAHEILSRLENYVNCYIHDEILSKYKSRSCVVGKNVTVLGHMNPFNAVVCDFNSDFSLKVVTEDGITMSLRSGEISIKI